MKPTIEVKNHPLIVKLLWTLFPNSTYELWLTSFNKGMESGRRSEKKAVEDRLREHDLADFGKPSLTLGYHTAKKAALGEIEI